MALVTLHDDRQVDSMGRDWQLECLARWALAKPLEDRRTFLAGMDKRSPRDADELRKVMTALHQKARVAA